MVICLEIWKGNHTRHHLEQPVHVWEMMNAKDLLTMDFHNNMSSGNFRSQGRPHFVPVIFLSTIFLFQIIVNCLSITIPIRILAKDLQLGLLQWINVFKMCIWISSRNFRPWEFFLRIRSCPNKQNEKYQKRTGGKWYCDHSQLRNQFWVRWIAKCHCWYCWKYWYGHGQNSSEYIYHFDLMWPHSLRFWPEYDQRNTWKLRRISIAVDLLKAKMSTFLVRATK